MIREKKFISPILIFIALILNQCNSDENSVNYAVFPKIIKIEKYDWLPLEIDSISLNPKKICIVDSFLIVNNLKTSPLLDLYNLREMKYICSFGQKGNGPNEFLDVKKVSNIPGTKIIGVFSIVSQKITFINLDSLVLKKSFGSLKPVSFRQLSYNIHDFELLSDSTFLCHGYYPDCRLKIINSEGLLIKTLGKLPDVKGELNRLSKEELAMAYYGVLGSDYERKIFLIGSLLAQQVEIFKGSQHLTSIGAEVPLPEGSIEGHTFQFSEKSKETYDKVCANNKYIFLHYSGNSMEEISLNKIDTGFFIHVFDWYGNPVCSVESPLPIITMDLDYLNNRLVCIVQQDSKCRLVTIGIDDLINTIL